MLTTVREMPEQRSPIPRWERFLLAGLCLLAAAGVTLWALCQPKGNRVEIYVGDTLYTSCPLREDVITIDQGDGCMNRIHITEEGAEMLSSTCDGQDCVRQGMLCPGKGVSMGNMIVCLPHSVVIRLAKDE